VDDAGGVVPESLERVQLAVHEGVPGGLVRQGADGEAVPHDAAHRRGVQRLHGGAHLGLPRDPRHPGGGGRGAERDGDLLGRPPRDAALHARVRARQVHRVPPVPERHRHRPRGTGQRGRRRLRCGCGRRERRRKQQQAHCVGAENECEKRVSNTTAGWESRCGGVG
jgi:hypothetical protein